MSQGKEAWLCVQRQKAVLWLQPVFVSEEKTGQFHQEFSGSLSGEEEMSFHANFTSCGSNVVFLNVLDLKWPWG